MSAAVLGACYSLLREADIGSWHYKGCPKISRSRSKSLPADQGHILSDLRRHRSGPNPRRKNTKLLWLQIEHRLPAAIHCKRDGRMLMGHQPPPFPFHKA